VVEAGVVEDLEDGAAGSGLGVGGGVDEAADAGVEDGAGAHGAGFEGGVEVAGVEAVVAERLTGGAEGYDLGVGCGVGIGDDAVLTAGENDPVADEDGSYGDFAASFGGAGFGDGLVEEV
jgi:hypothetical protein